MLSALRRRLTALFTALTALVLACALAVTWYLAAAQYRASQQVLFANTLAALCDRLSDADTVADSWLAQQEAASGCAILLLDGGAALHFPGTAATRTDRATLRETALAQAQAAGLDSTACGSDGAALRQTVYFALAGAQGEQYQGAAALLPRGRAGGYLLLFLLRDTAFLARHSRQTALQYAGLWLLGGVLLAGISWWLAGLALAPTRQALQRQNEFVAAASHELRSPLAVIKASLEAVRDPAAPPDRRAPLLAAAEGEADRMARLVGDLLLLAGSDANALTVRLAPTPPDTLCIELYDQYYLLARRSGHPLALQLPDTAVPAVPADAERLRQLLAILLNNALEHTPPGTPVELALACGGRRPAVTLAVIDHGPGIPDGEKPHIFDRFYRADHNRTDKSHFGLGLSVAAELARLHGAALLVEDTPGGGATLRVTLPACPPGSG